MYLEQGLRISYTQACILSVVKDTVVVIPFPF